MLFNPILKYRSTTIIEPEKNFLRLWKNKKEGRSIDPPNSKAYWLFKKPLCVYMMIRWYQALISTSLYDEVT